MLFGVKTIPNLPVRSIASKRFIECRLQIGKKHTVAFEFDDAGMVYSKNIICARWREALARSLWPSEGKG